MSPSIPCRPPPLQAERSQATDLSRTLSSIAMTAGAIAVLLVSAFRFDVLAKAAERNSPEDLRGCVPYGDFIREGYRRFAIPEVVICAVLQVESAGRAQTSSSRGALGLMQIMPQTWAELSSRYRLGSNPLDPRANILAGSAYLREMLDRFGSAGVFAAYNAGPGRYLEHFEMGRPLPLETQIYAAKLRMLVGSAKPTPAALFVNWQRSPLFFETRPGAEHPSHRDSPGE